MMTTDNKMIFNEIVVYIFVALFGVSTALVGWVAAQTVELLRVSASIQEHNKATDSIIASTITLTQEQTRQINDIRLNMAQHGWDKK